MNTTINEQAVQRIVTRFQAHTLPAAEWTHQAHLIMGLYFLQEMGLDVGIEKIREGIKTYNVAVGTPNTESGGYHESITRFFMHALLVFSAEFPPSTLSDQVNQLDGSLLLQPDFMLQFYSRGLLFSAEARLNWVEPDLQPLNALSTLNFRLRD